MVKLVVRGDLESERRVERDRGLVVGAHIEPDPIDARGE